MTDADVALLAHEMSGKAYRRRIPPFSSFFGPRGGVAVVERLVISLSFSTDDCISQQNFRRGPSWPGRQRAGARARKPQPRGDPWEIVTRSRAELDLINGPAVRAFFEEQRPRQVILAAAKVGGIKANNDFPVEFLLENLKIQKQHYRVGLRDRGGEAPVSGKLVHYPSSHRSRSVKTRF